jgi:phospholipid/cholesterol/gamma-HCH transport system substrate-binding protein
MEPERKSIQILLGVLILVTLSTLVWLSFRLASNAPANAVSYELLLDSALGLYPDNPVTIAGVPVGVVQSVGIEGKMARVQIALRPDLPVHEDAKAAVRARSLLGEKYIDLDPGTQTLPLLTPGATLKNNEKSVEIDHVIRASATLVDSLNRLTPSIERAVQLLEGTLNSPDAKPVTEELSNVLKQAGELVITAKTMLTDNKDDISALIRSFRARAPSVLDKIDRLSGQLKTAVRRTDSITEKKLKTFLQEEGVRVKIFPLENSSPFLPNFLKNDPTK